VNRIPSSSQVARWDVFEASFAGPTLPNPFLDAQIEADFSFGNRVIRVPGFYDGANTWRVRFMPDTEGVWTYRTVSASAVLDGLTGTFTCTAARAGRHGPVRVAHRYHFAHADGTPYFPFGTTCYAWTHQPQTLQQQTLDTLRQARFNKVRMCVFPKHYIYNENEPLYPAFESGSDGSQDFDRPNVAMYQHFERQIEALRELGIQADVILFHPYDRWGYVALGEKRDCDFLRYIVARLAAYDNVWWSLANEYDFMLDVKPVEQWDRYFHLIEALDPYRHLKSIHNGHPEMSFDHRKPWVDHVCIQHWDVKRTAEWRAAWGKPIVNDEPEYEGNISRAWGNIHGRELVHRYWLTVLRGGYAGHGETYAHPDDELWWAKGGKLYGESWRRIGFLRDLIEQDVKTGLTPYTSAQGSWEFTRVSGAQDGDVRYLYFGEHQPLEWAMGLPKDDAEYDIDLIDTWAMTVTRVQPAPLPAAPPLRGVGGVLHSVEPEAAFGVRLPGKPYLAIRVRRRR